MIKSRHKWKERRGGWEHNQDPVRLKEQEIKRRKTNDEFPKQEAEHTDVKYLYTGTAAT